MVFHAKWAGICEKNDGQSGWQVIERTPRYQILSNLVPSEFALAEKIYQGSKFTFDHESAQYMWDAAWDKLEWLGANDSDFQRALITLQPEKKQWTDGQLQYWYIDGVPVTGILFKLMQGVIPKPGASLTRKQRVRLGAFLDLTNCGLSVHDVKFVPQANKSEKKQKMLEAMMRKFQGRAGELLLETYDMVLQERPSRGNGRSTDLWSKGFGGGDNLCGECLMEVRCRLKAVRKIPQKLRNVGITAPLIAMCNVLQFLTLKEQSRLTRANRDWMGGSQGNWCSTQAIAINNANIILKPRTGLYASQWLEITINFSEKFVDMDALGVALRKLPTRAHLLDIYLESNIFEINCCIAKYCEIEVNEFYINFEQGFTCKAPIVLDYHVKASSLFLSWDVFDVDRKTLEHVLLKYDVPPATLEMTFDNVYDMSLCMFLLELVTRRFWQYLRCPTSTMLKFHIDSVDDEDEWSDLDTYSDRLCDDLESLCNNDSNLTYGVYDKTSGRRSEYSCCL